MIRLAVRCLPEQAEIVLAELMVLAPNGVEEENGPGYVEYAIYGGEGELPALGEIEAAAGEGLVEVVSAEVPDDWADRWQDFHRPILVGERLYIRPSWEPPARRASDASKSDSSRASTMRGNVPIDVVVDPGRAFGTGAHPTTRLCLELLLELAGEGEAEGRLTDLGTGSGLLAIAAAKLGWGPIRGYDHEEPSIEAATANAVANGVEVAVELRNIRDSLPPLAPTTVANLTASVLREVAAQLAGDSGESGRARRSLPAVAPEGPSRFPRTLVLSGLLPTELDEIAGAFAASGFVEAERRHDGDWAALLLRRL
jgi:ribosomal protein L11 methyltransferase